MKTPFSDMDWERMFNLLDEVVADLIAVERTYEIDQLNVEVVHLVCSL